MKTRLGNCEYCSVPIMDCDYHCVGCGAPAILRHEMIEVPDPECYGQSFYIDGGVMPSKENPYFIDASVPIKATLSFAEWNK